MIRKLLLCTAALGLVATAAAQDVALVNAKIWTGTDAGTRDNATIFMSDGVIEGMDVNFAPPSGTQTIDVNGNWVTPGIIAPFSRVGTVEVGAEDTTNDTSAGGSPFSVALRAADGFNPAATAIAVTRIEGVTRVAVAPANGSSMIAGQGFVADTTGSADSISDERAFIYINLGEGGAGGTKRGPSQSYT